MIVLITGMFRSGSTWSFNVVKHLLSKQFGPGQIRTAAQDDAKGFLSGADEDKALVLKGHYLDDYARESVKHRSAKIIHTFRDPSEAISSGRRVFSDIPFEDSLRMIAASFAWMDLILESSNGCLIFYEDIECQPQSLIRNIGEYLGIPLDDKEVTVLAHELHRDSVRPFTDGLRENRPAFEASGRIVHVGFSYYDEPTFFHRSHIAPVDQVYQPLHASELTQLLSRAGSWLDGQGKLIARESRFLNGA